MNTATLNEVVEISIDPASMQAVAESGELSAQVASLSIKNNQEYTNSAEFLKKVKGTSKSLDDARKEITRPLDEAKKRVMDFFRDPIEMLAKAETVLKSAMLDFTREQERIHREAEAKAIAEARAAEERRRKALEEQAAKAAEKGNEAKAEMLKAKAEEVYVPAVVVAPTIDKVKGISTKKVWKFRITDEKAIPREYLSINEGMLGKMAMATQGKIPVPGVEFYQEDVISAGRG